MGSCQMTMSPQFMINTQDKIHHFGNKTKKKSEENDKLIPEIFPDREIKTMNYNIKEIRTVIMIKIRSVLSLATYPKMLFKLQGRK